MLASALLFLSQTPANSGPGLHELVTRIPSFARCQSEDGLGPADLRALQELTLRRRGGETIEFADWKQTLLERGWLRWRERWPKSEPFAIGLHLPQAFASRIELVPRVPGWRKAHADSPSWCGTGAWETFEAEDYQVLGLLPEAELDIVFDLVLVDGRSPDSQLGQITLHVSAVANVEDCLPALRDHAREAEVGQRLAQAVRVIRELDGQQRASYEVTLDPAVRVPGLALGLLAILRRQGKARECAWGIPLEPWQEFHWSSWDLPRSHYDRPIEIREHSLVLRGDARYALRDWDAREYWAGEVEVRLEDLDRR